MLDKIIYFYYIIIDFIINSPWLTVLYVLLIFLFFVFIYDVFIQKKHTIKHNFPIVGHIRYWLETIGPELRQYIVADDKEEMPFNRAERRWIYASSKNQNNYFGFGTTELIYSAGYPIIKNAAIPFPEEKATYINNDPTAIPCLKIMGESYNRKKAYRPTSIINISAMSFGSLGKRAISALNKGALLANCYHNSGEGSVSKYHLLGADIVLQIGTGYFGVRDEKGNFSLDKLAQLTHQHQSIKAIEIKLSQGAKPGKGGVLPAKKISAEISQTRGIPMGQDCLSPNAHKEFSNTKELITFIKNIADVSGLPVGIKAAIGKLDFWQELAEEIKNKKQGPDFITIDGGEGGTGAAPLTYADHVSLPFKTSFSRVYKIFLQNKLAEKIVWVGSGKLGFPDRTLVALAMGCDLINIAREAMLSIGCIQAQQCHTGECPAGIATQNPWLESGLHIEHKAKRFANYVKIFRKELLSLAHTAGYEHPSQVTGQDIEISAGINQYQTLDHILGYTAKKPLFTQMLDYN